MGHHFSVSLIKFLFLLIIVRYGLAYKIQVPLSNETVEIADLLTTLYEKAIEKKNWGLVRHSAGNNGFQTQYAIVYFSTTNFLFGRISWKTRGRPLQVSNRSPGSAKAGRCKQDTFSSVFFSLHLFRLGNCGNAPTQRGLSWWQWEAIL